MRKGYLCEDGQFECSECVHDLQASGDLEISNYHKLKTGEDVHLCADCYEEISYDHFSASHLIRRFVTGEPYIENTANLFR